MMIQKISVFGFILFFMVALAGAASVNGKVSKVVGTAEIQLPGEADFKPLKEGDKVPPGSTIKTGNNSRAVILTLPGAALRISADSVVKITEMDFTKGQETDSRKARIILNSGTVSAMIDKEAADITDFRVKTPQGVAAARGTFFGVTVDKGKTYLTVKEGNVGVTRLKPKKKAAEGDPSAEEKKN